MSSLGIDQSPSVILDDLLLAPPTSGHRAGDIIRCEVKKETFPLENKNNINSSISKDKYDNNSTALNSWSSGELLMSYIATLMKIFKVPLHTCIMAAIKILWHGFVVAELKYFSQTLVQDVNFWTALKLHIWTWGYLR